MTVKKKKQTEVSVNDLKDGMIIAAYTSFSSDYRPMDKSTSDFIRHNFRNTRAIIRRTGNKQDIPIKFLKTGDELLRIHSLPPTLKKLMFVNKALAKELKKRGMIGFQVNLNKRIADESRRDIDLKELIKQVEQTSEKKSRKGLSVIQEKRQQKADIANKLISKVSESLEYRREATALVENTMDLIRKGKTSIKEIKLFTKSILKNASTDAMTALAGLKHSDHIYSHCVDVGAIYQSTYAKIIEKKRVRNVFQNQFDVFMGALLHDMGKSKIPKEIIDSTEHYERNSRATQILRSHPIFGAEILAKMNMPNSIINMTHHHHVKLDTAMLSSYPTGVDFKDVMFETRLLSIVDVYQALVGKREYKRSWSPPSTMRYLDALAGIEYDLRVWEPFLQTMGIYPKGSLVKLSDSSLGFVMNVPRPGQNLEKPLVAIIRDSRGEDLTHHDIIDLSVEKGVKIAKDIDSQEIFGDNALEVFTNISVS
ncbi:MAG: HDIG domain-containing protein [Deltaproteobacteria bacterium]|jgi:putative nucleotidyltransferase with HDIG domain|nr:HDIG domain-containing protein [Deltaproteobacteria bacterium]MBT4269141.1 HDIG domain-containing protein [Deltaproteobacteria bacterium]MBT4641317.1 HDIG domain-containing protein [Deltaproteobacteria bacterium]MBT6499419.1 HDIG domain-containing protein [Deltaproteobacteria bacterium]MBT6611852.1 HDIG domain-containing protein [Deltaproteobacteria bacterium]